MEIKIRQLQKRFGEKIAVDIDQYHIHAGELLGIVGNNGAGKTTLFRLMLDLSEASRGNVFMDDSPVNQQEDWKQYTGAFLDNSFLINYLTPEEFFEFIGKIYGLGPDLLQQRLALFQSFMREEILNQKKFIRDLSSGNQQKVGIIAALLHQPQLVILDEPFNFLDPTSQRALKHLLKEYHRQTGATILISSHNLEHTLDLCPRIALMEKGKIIKDFHQNDSNMKSELEKYFNEPA